MFCCQLQHVADGDTAEAVSRPFVLRLLAKAPLVPAGAVVGVAVAAGFDGAPAHAQLPGLARPRNEHNGCWAVVIPLLGLCEQPGLPPHLLEDASHSVACHFWISFFEMALAVLLIDCRESGRYGDLFKPP